MPASHRIVLFQCADSSRVLIKVRSGLLRKVRPGLHLCVFRLVCHHDTTLQLLHHSWNEREAREKHRRESRFTIKPHLQKRGSLDAALLVLMQRGGCLTASRSANAQPIWKRKTPAEPSQESRSIALNASKAPASTTAARVSASLLANEARVASLDFVQLTRA